MASRQAPNATSPSETPDTRNIPQSAPQESLTDRLRRLRVRVTPQRLFVLEALELNSGHMTAEEIMRWASRRYPALNLATVYRALDLLTEVGLVAQTDLGGGAASYELVGDAPHHHLACEGCGAVIEMDEALLEGLRAEALRVYGFHARPRHLAIFGLCQGCWEAGRGATPASPLSSQERGRG
jgi:Fur family ferric uptake transcriptional regulator